MNLFFKCNFFQVILIYPGDHSVTLEELYQQLNLVNSGHSESVQTTSADYSSSLEESSTANATEGKTMPIEDLPEGNAPEENNTAISDAVIEPPLKRSRIEIRDIGRCPFTKVVFIDSTWSQAKKIYLDERLKGIPKFIYN